MNKFFVRKEWKTKYPNPIQLTKGEIVTLIREEESENWKGWIFCESSDNEGWVPKQIIKIIDSSMGVILDNYSAKELNVRLGDIVIGKKELNGWIWCKNYVSHEEGWLPLDILNIE